MSCHDCEGVTPLQVKCYHQKSYPKLLNAMVVCVCDYIFVVCHFSHLNRVTNRIQVKTKCLIEWRLSVMATHSGLLLYDLLLSCHIHHIKFYIQVYKDSWNIIDLLAFQVESKQNLYQYTIHLSWRHYFMSIVFMRICWGTLHYRVGGLEIWTCRWCFYTAGSQEPTALLQSSSLSSMQPWSHPSSYLQSDDR